MNVLAHRNISQMDVRGTVEVNDRPIGRKINAISAYIQQEDLFVGSSTVREHLTFQVNDVTFSFLRMMYYSLSDTGKLGKGKSECSYQKSNLRSSDYYFGYSTTELQ